MNVITIDKKGKISLSEQIREKLGWQNNEQLSLEIEGNRLILKPVDKEPEVEYENNVLVVKSPVTGSLEEVVEEERQRRIEQIMSW